MADTNNYHIDEQEKQVVEDEGSSVPIRTKHYSSYYGCTFCKRGFTKAQALGGHMNIHRKHKSLIMKKKGSKQLLEVNNANSSSSSSNYKVSCSNNSIEESSLEVQNYKNLERNNYYPSSSSSSLLYVSESYLNNDGKQDENIGGGNLSLQVGPTHLEEENGEVDLELRLGHYPQ